MLTFVNLCWAGTGERCCPNNTLELTQEKETWELRWCCLHQINKEQTIFIYEAPLFGALIKIGHQLGKTVKEWSPMTPTKKLASAMIFCRPRSNKVIFQMGWFQDIVGLMKGFHFLSSNQNLNRGLWEDLSALHNHCIVI